MKRILLSLLVCFHVFTSCKKEISAPVELYSKDAAHLEAKLSYLNLPLNLRIEKLEALVNENLPKTIYTSNEDNLILNIVKGGTFRFVEVRNDEFTFEIPLKIHAEKKVGAFGLYQTAKTDFEVNLTFQSKIFLGANWKLISQTKPGKLTFKSTPKLSISGISVPIESLTRRVIESNYNLICRSIDENISESFDLEKEVLSLWNYVKQPQNVSEEYNTWIQIEPQDVLMTPLKSTTKGLELNIILKALIKTETKEKVETKVAISSSLPPIKFVESAPSGFNFIVYNLLSFKEAENLAKTNFGGETFDFNNGKYKVKIEDLEIYGTETNKLAIKATLSGTFNGVVYLTGTPKINAEEEYIWMDDLDFNLSSKSFLLKSASWLLDGIVKKKLTNNFHFPYRDLINEIKIATEESFNKSILPGINVSSKILKAEPISLSIQPEGIFSEISVIGLSQLIIE